MKASETNSLQRRDFSESRTNRARSSSFSATFNNQDEVETVLSQAQELIGRAMSSRRRGDEHHIRHLPGDDMVFHSVAGQMIMEAQREILCVLSADDISLDRRNHTLHLLQGAHRRGVHVKALVPSSVTASLVAAVRAMNDHPGYRARDFPDQNLVIVDGREAALRMPGPDESAQMLLVSAHPLVHFLKTMFGISWSSGTPLAKIFHANEKLRGQPAQSILASLRAGEKDEVAARKLGMSVRTYRRHVAEIMRDVRATSRFQAGVRAAELGLIF
jgi:hypothetical protein